MEMLDAMALQNSMLTRSQKQMSKKQQCRTFYASATILQLFHIPVEIITV